MVVDILCLVIFEVDKTSIAVDNNHFRSLLNFKYIKIIFFSLLHSGQFNRTILKWHINNMKVLINLIKTNDNELYVLKYLINNITMIVLSLCYSILL